MTPSPTRARSMRPFLIIWFGQIVSVIGSEITSFGLSVWVFNETERATPFALAMLFTILPMVLLSPVAGAVVDRANRRWIMVVADGGNALRTAVVLILLLTGQLAVWHVFVLAAVGSLLSAFQVPAYTSSVSLLVPEKQLGRASGLLQLEQAFSLLLAPALAGVLFTLVGLLGIVAVDFVTFFIAIATLLRVHIPQPPRDPDAKPTSIWRDVALGWAYIRARSALLTLLFYFSLVNFFFNLTTVLLGPLVLSFSTAAAYGLVQAVVGAGMLLAGLLLSAWGGPTTGRRVPTILALLVLGALGIFATGLERSVLAIAIGAFIMMFPIPLATGIYRVIAQVKVEPVMQGRFFATSRMISLAMTPVAYLVAGPLADGLFEPLLRVDGPLAGTALGALVGTGAGRGIGLLYLINALILIALSALVFANPRVRRLERELPDALPAKESAGELAGEPVAPSTTASTPYHAAESNWRESPEIVADAPPPVLH